MKPQNIIGYILKVVSFFSSIGVLLLGASIFIYSLYDILYIVLSIGGSLNEEGQILLKALKAIDLVLISITLFIIAIGLFELFISPIENIPDWLYIKNIDELKGLLTKVLVVVIGVSFTGRVVTWDGETDLFSFGLGVAAVILALSYFLRGKKMDS